MKKVVMILAMLLLSAGVLSAQRIYFCSNYTQDGEPISPNLTWEINKDGGYVYILFQSGGKSIRGNQVYLYVDKLAGDSYKPFEVKTLQGEKGKNWIAYDYQFINAGSYRVTVQDTSRQELAKDFVTINFKTTTTSQQPTTTTDNKSGILYYASSKIVSGTGFNSETNDIINQNTSFSIDATAGGSVTFLVSNNGNPISTDQLIVDVWKKDYAGEYKFHETKYYNTTGTYTKVYFAYDFFTSGDYKVMVYNKEGTWINTSYVNIIYR